MKTAIPNEAERYFYQPSSWVESLDWNKVFAISHSQFSTPNSQFIHVDLGAGDGGFICQRAQRHPETHFLGVERLLGRARKIAKRAFRRDLANLRVLRIEAAYAVEYLFPPSSISSMTILFPDPWPKRRHHKNRLVQVPFLENCAKCLQKEGWLAVKTDDESYFKHIIAALDECRGLKRWEKIQAEDLIPETTDFEEDFKKEGREFFFVAARRG